MFGSGRVTIDATLGELRWKRRAWRGAAELPDGASVQVVVPGGRSGPDPDAVTRVAAALADYSTLRPLVAAALAEHHPDVDVRQVAEADVPAPRYAAAIELDGKPAVELGYEVPWDDEHTLGARFRGQDLLELNGSVLAP